MKEVRFIDPAGSVRQGEWNDGTIEFASREYEPDDVEILPPCSPSKIVCVAANYVEHAREGGKRIPDDLPDRPSLFLKPPNAVAGHGDTVTLPTPGVSEGLEDSGVIERGEGRIDYEGELGVVIGRQCRNVEPDRVGEVIRGYTCVNDISNRDDQAAERNWVRGKAFDGSAPIGPVVATFEELLENPRIRTRVNGETRQDSRDDELIFSIREVIAEATAYLTLEPGDVVAMGTTAGVGRLSDGDEVEIEIDGVGTLVHHVAE